MRIVLIFLLLSGEAWAQAPQRQPSEPHSALAWCRIVKVKPEQCDAHFQAMPTPGPDGMMPTPPLPVLPPPKPPK